MFRNYGKNEINNSFVVISVRRFDRTYEHLSYTNLAGNVKIIACRTSRGAILQVWHGEFVTGRLQRGVPVLPVIFLGSVQAHKSTHSIMSPLYKLIMNSRLPRNRTRSYLHNMWRHNAVPALVGAESMRILGIIEIFYPHEIQSNLFYLPEKEGKT